MGSGRSLEEEANIPKDFYFGDSYFDRRQLISLATQIKSVYDLRPRRILEIGVGNGFVSDFLRKAGFEVVTADINASLSPDVVCDIRKLDSHFDAGEFDLTLCAEVLEHLPFSDFRTAISGIAHTTSQHAVLTIPRSQRHLIHWHSFFTFPKLGSREFGFTFSRSSSKVWQGHHWELDCRPECSRKAVRRILERDFDILSFKKESVLPYHEFITLRKSV